LKLKKIQPINRVQLSDMECYLNNNTFENYLLTI